MDAEFQKERKGGRVREIGLDRNAGHGLAIKLKQAVAAAVAKASSRHSH